MTIFLQAFADYEDFVNLLTTIVKGDTHYEKQIY